MISGRSARDAKLEQAEQGSDSKAFLQGHGNEGDRQRSRIGIHASADLGKASERPIGRTVKFRKHRSEFVLALHQIPALYPSARSLYRVPLTAWLMHCKWGGKTQGLPVYRLPDPACPSKPVHLRVRHVQNTQLHPLRALPGIDGKAARHMQHLAPPGEQRFAKRLLGSLEGNAL